MRVYWEETGEAMEVQRACKVCRVELRPFTMLSGESFVLSPAGIAHHTDDYGETICGKDATRNGWWWPC